MIEIKNSHITRLEIQVREQRDNNSRIVNLETDIDELKRELEDLKDLNTELLEELTEVKEKNRIYQKTSKTENTILKSQVIKA